MRMKRNPTLSLARLLYIIQRCSDRYARRVLGPVGVGKEHLFYLGSLINEGDGVTQEELAGRLHVNGSSAARMLAALEQRGLVTRTRVTGNARAYRVEVTPRGRALWEELLDDLWCWEDTLTEGFSAREREQARALLERMQQNAVAAVEDGFRRCGGERSTP